MDKYLSYIQDLDDKEFRIFICSMVLKLPRGYVSKTTNLTTKEIDDKIRMLKQQKEYMYLKELITEAVMANMV